jgi:hypothetical protein
MSALSRQARLRQEFSIVPKRPPKKQAHPATRFLRAQQGIVEMAKMNSWPPVI